MQDVQICLRYFHTGALLPSCRCRENFTHLLNFEYHVVRCAKEVERFAALHI